MLIIGICLLIGSILVSNESARRTEQQQLEALDKLFNTARNPVPVVVTDVTILPEYIGSFKRDDISIYDYVDGCYAWNTYGNDICYSATYEDSSIVDKYGRSPIISLKIWTNRGQSQIKDIAGSPHLCDAEIGGVIHLRTEANFPYLYAECSVPFTAQVFLNGIVWQNGTWMIGIEGEYEALCQFIADYPY